MRWDYGQIFKEIRKSKGLTQQDVCGQVIHRTTLTNIEHGKVIPSFENMVFLLEQIDMSLAEFKYICNEYHPSKRRDIIVESQNPSTFQDTRKMVELTENVKNILRHITMFLFKISIVIQKLSQSYELKDSKTTTS